MPSERRQRNPNWPFATMESDWLVPTCRFKISGVSGSMHHMTYGNQLQKSHLYTTESEEDRNYMIQFLR